MEKEEWYTISSSIQKQISSYADAYLQIQNQFQDAFVKQQSILEPVLKEYIDTINRTKSIYQPLLNDINEITSQFKEAFDFSGIASTLQSVSIPHEIWERQEKEEKLYINRLALIGWPFLLDVPISFISQFNEEFELKDRDDFIKEFELAICDFYSEENLKKVLDRWNGIEILKNRIVILRDVIDSHINKKYTLSIPTLLPHIEGTLSEYYITNTEPGKKKINIYIDYLLEENDRYLPFKGIIVDKLYEHFHWGDQYLPSLSRHAILHGADTNYYTEINSLKVILIFDMIIYILKKGA